ncbi:MAG: 5-(carboxyamino)imidazole ribonucleotide synthase [Nocardioidaceae bacterium]
MTDAGKSPIGGPILGVVGGGQLARMTQQAAIALGVPIKLLAEGPDVSAAQVVRDAVIGDYRDVDTLLQFAADCAVVTFDHEHVPTDHLRALERAGYPCRPGPDALLHAQDKACMRARLQSLQVPCPRWTLVSSSEEVRAFAESAVGWPVVLKTPRGGYDGKGVWVVREPSEAAEPISQGAKLAEEWVDFRRELSVLVARSPSGQTAVYPVVESIQFDGVCREVIAPAPHLAETMSVDAQQIALTTAGALGVAGVMAIELFETKDGRILVNELAMRPHNTGHWTIEGAITSQFENHVRAVLDLPLGAPRARARWTVMVNILGSRIGDLYDGYLHAMARDPRLKVHVYGKVVEPGRKLGHVTAYGDDLEDALQRARHAAAWFQGDLGNESVEE